MHKLTLLFLLPLLAAVGCVSLTPEESVNVVGGDHTVTATFFDGAGDPLVGETANFIVTAGPNAGQNGSDITDANGQATFTYTSNGQPGTDTIQACASGLCNTAIKHWAVAKDFGDVDCSSGEPTLIDSLKIQQHVAGVPVSQVEPCTDIGTDVLIIPAP